MSGYTANVLDRRDLIAPGFVLIEKPFSTSTLLQNVREAIRR
jgi:hypothetical protein